VVNGVISPLLIAAILVVSNDKRILGRNRNGPISNLLGGASVVIMSLAAAAMAVAFVLGQGGV
jgi:Mn2+/Fe2+ NRAMP family transporter